MTPAAIAAYLRSLTPRERDALRDAAAKTEAAASSALAGKENEK